MLNQDLSSFAHRTAKGLTLIQLLLVIVILAILAVVLIKGVDTNYWTLDAEQARLIQAIRYTQVMAMAQDQRLRINFFADRYSITNLNGTTGISSIGDQDGVVYFSSGTQLTSSGLANNYVVFNGQGFPFTDTNIPGTSLANNVTLTLSKAGQSRSITIQGQTGAIQ